MNTFLQIRPLERGDIASVTDWARQEGFSPGAGDVAIYRHTDRQGLWVGWLGSERIGCISGVRYSAEYGFIGLYLVRPEWRGQGYGLQLWSQAMQHLDDLACIGVEAALDRVDDYRRWGFVPATTTTRWQIISDGSESTPSVEAGWQLLSGDAIPQRAVQCFDAQREASPRPHFLSQWLNHPAGTVLALIDAAGTCHGFGRIRPCLLPRGEGWRIGPLMAETPQAAGVLLQGLLQRHSGVVLLDAPGGNGAAAPLLQSLQFSPISSTKRMYRGTVPSVSLSDVYGLACLELG